MSKLAKKIFIGIVFLVASFSYYFYQAFFTPNVNEDFPMYTFHIQTGGNFKTVRDHLLKKKIINDVISFSFVAKVLKYQDNVKAGKYSIKKGMNNLELVRMLRNAAQTPVNVIFNNKRLKEDLAGNVCKNLECSTNDFIALLNNNAFLKEYGFDSLTVPAVFIPNTYQFYWNTSAESLFKRMKKEYDLFWNDERLAKAKNIGLSPVEVSILASIVEEEQKRLTKERPTIAGVYLNRLKNKRLLQADPTVKFALGDFTLKRVKDLSIDSPYNTYKYVGLPPGPICIPSINAIDAVLNAEDHSYLYFCARPDGSGYHDFSKTFEAHKQKAIKYRRQQRRNGNH